jgi:acid phosphatase (class A)
VRLARRYAAAAVIALVVSSAATWWSQRDSHHYLSGETTDFVGVFSAPPAPDSAQTRAELGALLTLQRIRTPADVAAARADRKKDISRFYAALGLDAAHPPKLPHLQALTDDVEADIGPYVRAAKRKFRRLRPYEIEPRLEPCIADLQGDLSYPSGHSTYGYLMSYLLIEMVPEREKSLTRRADEFAHQRMVCGVHFESDLLAGREAASFLFLTLDVLPDFRRDLDVAMSEVRAALELSPRAPR